MTQVLESLIEGLFWLAKTMAPTVIRGGVCFDGYVLIRFGLATP